jgi:hypothetical protein
MQPTCSLAILPDSLQAEEGELFYGETVVRSKLSRFVDGNAS